MTVYRYQLASENIRTLFIFLDLLLICVPDFANDIVRLGLVADQKVMPGNHISESLSNEICKNHKYLKICKTRCMILGIHTRIIYDFFVVIQGSYYDFLVIIQGSY